MVIFNKRKIIQALVYTAFSAGIFYPAKAQNVNIGLNILRFNSVTVSPDVPFTTSAGPQFAFRMDHAAGLEGGFYLEKTFNPSLAIQTELLWRFTTIAIISKDSRAGMEWTNGAFAVPVFFKYRFGGFAIMAGPEVGVNLLSDKTGKGAFANIQYKSNEVADFERLSWAAIAGMEYTTKRPGIGFHVRYSAGLNSVWNKKEHPLEAAGYTYETANINAWQFGLHWRFTKDRSRMNKKNS